jgi:hypothetical protein
MKHAYVITVGEDVEDVVFGNRQGVEDYAIGMYDCVYTDDEGSLETPDGVPVDIHSAAVAEPPLIERVDNLNSLIDELRHAVLNTDHARQAYWSGQLQAAVSSIVAETTKDAAHLLQSRD